MKPEISDKHDLILEAAIRRFSHFGIQKTNMTEIAEDVAMSKQSLAYYFPDKQYLIAAVVTKIIDTYLHELEANCQNAASVEEALIRHSEIKKKFFERYYMLYIQNFNVEVKSGHAEIAELKNSVRLKEMEMISRMIEAGIGKGELRPVDVKKTSNLLLDTLAAFECSVKVEKVIPQHDDFLAMIKKQKEVLHLFIKGLKS
ncbi:MAG: TetR/AcrR family transcriptional regulator [Chitinophagaceae bacterium]